MSKKNSWEEFFDAHAPVYEDNEFTQNTAVEVDFLLDVLSIKPGSHILDIGCGTGRHSIELAKRGYLVTGLDISAEMLKIAADSARKNGVTIEWIQSDATSFSLPEKFDAAICLCEGAFGLLGTGEDALDHPLSILKNISACLKKGSKVLFTVLNGIFMIRSCNQTEIKEGHFDLISIVRSSDFPPREGLPEITVREKGFVPSELVLLFKIAGMTVTNIWGGTAGNWGKRYPDPDEMELMIEAQK